MFELFDHTADLGLRVEADSLKKLLSEAGLGLLSIFVANPQQVRPLRCLTMTLPGGEVDELLFDWLSELLFLFESEHWLLCRFEIAVNETTGTAVDGSLEAKAWGEPAGPRHELDHEVKAITYHDLEAKLVDGLWQATVIVDI